MERGEEVVQRRRPRGTPDARQFRSGTLTAGCLDDHADYEQFRELVSLLLQSPQGRSLPHVAPGRRVVIEVTDAAGRPVEGAGIVVTASDEQSDATLDTAADRSRRERFRLADRVGHNGAPPLLQTRTTSDGRTVFLTGIDATAASGEFVLTVTSPDAERTVSRRVSLEQTPWSVVLPQTTARLPRRLDLALVIDTTGSMADELEYLKVEIDAIAAEVHRRFPNVDQRFALVLYRDEGDEYVTRTFDFTGSLEEFRTHLSQQRAVGGGDYPEAMHLALDIAGRLSWRTDGTARVVFLVADAPPHREDMPAAFDAVRVLRRQAAKVYPVAGSGVAREAEYFLRTAAFLTRGKYLFLTDHSGVGLPHEKPHAASYQVERLDELMVRMIAEELSGVSSLPREVIGTERGAAVAPRPEQRPLPRPRHAAASFVAPGATDRAEAKSSVSPTVRWGLVIAALAAIVYLERRFA